MAGILTKRDVKIFKNGQKVSSVMTPREKCVVYKLDNESQIPTPDECYEIMLANRVEKLPLVTSNNKIFGMVTMKDLERSKLLP